MAANFAQTELKTAKLSQDFGESFARRIFGDETVDSLPRFVRGPRKGKLKGFIGWKKCVKGGWFKTGPGYYQDTNSGYIMKPGPIEWVLLSEDYVENDYGYAILETKHADKRPTPVPQVDRVAEIVSLRAKIEAFDNETTARVRAMEDEGADSKAIIAYVVDRMDVRPC